MLEVLSKEVFQSILIIIAYTSDVAEKIIVMRDVIVNYRLVGTDDYEDCRCKKLCST